MADGWAGRFSDFSGSTSSSKKPKVDSKDRHNNSFKFNSSRYAPLKLDTTPKKKEPLVQASTNTMGPPPSTSGFGASKKQNFQFKAEKVNPIPEDLDVDWGDDDLDFDLNNLDDTTEVTKKENEPKITNEELQEMTMDLLNDEENFSFDEEPPPMEPAKARLNQTTAVVAPSVQVFFDETPKPEEIIESLRTENKKLSTELKSLVPLDNQRKVENTELQKKLDKEIRTKKNLENDLRIERENVKKALREKEVEFRKLKAEFEKVKVQAAFTQKQQLEEDVAHNNERSSKKRKISSNGAEISIRSNGLPEKKPIEDLYSQSKIKSLPDFFVEQFCLLTAADPVCQKNILVKTRNSEETRGDWAQMLDISARGITRACCLPPASPKQAQLEETETNASALDTSSSNYPEQSFTAVDAENVTFRERICSSEGKVILSELENILQIINFNCDNFKSQEKETVLDVCTLILRCMMSLKDFLYLEKVTQVIRALWELEPPEVAHLNQIIPHYQEIFRFFQSSPTLQASPRDRSAVIDLFCTIADEEEILAKLCTRSDSCLLQIILRELESDCYKINLSSDVRETSEFSSDSEPYSSRGKLKDDCLNEEEVFRNHKVIEEGVDLLARFIDDSVMRTEPSPWINADCLNCTCILLRTVIALLFSCISAYLDSICDMKSVILCESHPHVRIIKHAERCLEALYKMKMEVVGYSEMVTQPWIKVFEQIQSGNRKTFVWSIDILKDLVSESMLPTLEKLEMERLK